MFNANYYKKILLWIKRINTSKYGIEGYYRRYNVPFSIAQYYRYKKKIKEGGIEAINDNRTKGNNRKLSLEAEIFFKGYLKSHLRASLSEIQSIANEHFGITISTSGISRCLKRLGYILGLRKRIEKVKSSYTVCAGFELIVALACHLKWPQTVAKVIQKRIQQIKTSEQWHNKNYIKDMSGRNQNGQFTAIYNRRPEVRMKKFESIENKRHQKNYHSMSIMKVNSETIQRKCLAALTLPVITNNGMIRSINTPMGNALLSLCGFNYKQATMNKFLSELKYLAVSEGLLRSQVQFWNSYWEERKDKKEQNPLLCYYVDGNTKALWPSKHVQQNKVTMLGRVMGCLEQVFVHDCYGRPVYFETYSGHGPRGENILSLFRKIEKRLSSSTGILHVNRAIVLDGASNSVHTLRAFAKQNKYHYITSLDDNQWCERKILWQGTVHRYRYGKATVRECEIELEDSQEKGYLIVVRAIKVEWDYGKTTVLLTSLDPAVIGLSEIVKGYFDRWPDQELSFKEMKAVASLHRVAGYGKQIIEDKKIKAKQEELKSRIEKLQRVLSEVLESINTEEKFIYLLVKKEQRFRRSTIIKNGIRVMSKEQSESFLKIGKEIKQHECRIKELIKPHEKLYHYLQKAKKEWMRIQGKEKVYKVDVELDQIMTFFRVGLVNLCSFLTDEIFQCSSVSMKRLFQSVLQIPGYIEETATKKLIMLEYNSKDKRIMLQLDLVLKKINKLGIKTLKGKPVEFKIGKIDYHLKSIKI